MAITSAGAGSGLDLESVISAATETHFDQAKQHPDQHIWYRSAEIVPHSIY